MNQKPLSTESYKGVRDFYPDDMAVQQYIFDVWSYTAESFGFARYDASVLEPSELYKAKGAENEEMVNEQTYTFTDRGEREVTLRPEMTPTVARMIAGKAKELAFPVRWYSIPNLFRYERAQRGRLREHWQLNCDLFGADDVAADIEVLLLAAQVLKNFGASNDMFEIRVNNRKTMTAAYQVFGITDANTITAITRLNDRKRKVTDEAYLAELTSLLHGDSTTAAEVKAMIESTDPGDNMVVATLRELGFTNVIIDRSLARGFDYYTGTIFEIFDTDKDNNRSLLGGGRYDNLTAMFGGQAISGIGFGMGDVTMRDFLEAHQLMPETTRSLALVVIPTDDTQHIAAERVAHEFRQSGFSVAVDIGTKKIGKKIADAAETGAEHVLIVGEAEVIQNTYTVKNLASGTETSGTLAELIESLIG